MTPNPKQKARAAGSRYNTNTGRGGPAFDKFAPIVRAQPIGVTDARQLMIPSSFNIPNELGVRNENFPMQELIPTRGGQWSGRTGPIG